MASFTNEAGQNNITGTVALSGTTSQINVTSGALELTGVVSGTGGFTKNGTGTLEMKNNNNSFTGQLIVNSGVLAIGGAGTGGAGNGMLGATGAGNETVINSGATLNIRGDELAGSNFDLNQERIIINGTGHNGEGAIQLSGIQSQMNALRFLTLGSNASIGGTTRFDIRNGGTLNLAGFTLKKTGVNQVVFNNITASAAGSIVVDQGTLTIEPNTVVSGTGTMEVNDRVNELAGLASMNI